MVIIMAESSRSKWVMIGAVIGLLIGGLAGFLISPSPDISGYQEQIEQLETQVTTFQDWAQDLDEELEDVVSEYTTLKNRFNELLQSQVTELEESESDYNSLELQFKNLQADYDDLIIDYEETSESYDQLLTDYETILGAVPLQPEPPSTEVIKKEYTWWYDGKKWTLSVNIPESIYEYYAEIERPPTEDYSIYVTHPFDDEYLRILIEKINFIAISGDYSEVEKVNLVISFVQSLPYTSDSVTTPYDEYPRYPLETLVDGGGDCEDSSILVSSLLYGMNYDVILLGLPGHMACGVYTQDGYGFYYLLNEREYYYLETTSEGWKIGDIPQDYEEEGAYLYELTATPIIAHDWSASWIGENLEISVTVSNLGTAIAQDIRVYAALDAGEGYVWNPVETESFDLEFGREITLDVIVEVPENEHMRLIIGVLDSEGYLIDKSNSEWFDT